MFNVWGWLKDNMQKQIPVYLVIAVLIAFSFLMVGCHLIPVNWTTDSNQKNLVKANSLQQVEFLRRIETMTPAQRSDFAKKGAEISISIEKIICGSAEDSEKILLQIIKEMEPKPLPVEPPK